jgi:hypothetical protein
MRRYLDVIEVNQVNHWRFVCSVSSVLGSRPTLDHQHMLRQIFAPPQFRLIARSYVFISLIFDISAFLHHFLNGFHRFLPLWRSQIGIPPKNALFFFRFTPPTLALQCC